MPPRALRAEPKNRDWQAEQVTRTGFPSSQQCAELANAVRDVLRAEGFRPRVCDFGAMLAAVSHRYNWQGNRRIAELLGCSRRTAQRLRKVLEAKGWIRSELLLPGDMLEGQRAPVWRPQVVRNVSKLQAAARAKLARLQRRQNPPRKAPPRKRRKPSAAEVPSTSAPSSAVTAAEIIAFAAGLSPAPKKPARGLQREHSNQVQRRAPESLHPATVTPEELDAWERETAELERGPPDTS